MVNIENEIFSAVAAALRVAFTGIKIDNEYSGTAAKFPCVTIEEIDNSVYTASQSSGNIENHANLSYEINAYSNKTSGRKAEVKSICAAADTVMAGLGFTRTFKQPTPNTADATVYRMTARYTAVVDKNKTIYRG